MLLVLACIGAANVVKTASIIQWNRIGDDVAKIWRGQGDDEPARADRQYQSIREVLAALNVHDKIGYITDLGPAEFDESYYLTQYSLLPLIVDDVPGNLPYVVGNFHHSETDPNNIPNLQPVVIAEGRVLFRRRTP